MSAPKPSSGTKPKSGAKVRPLGYADSPLASTIGGKLFGFNLLITATFVFLLIGFSFYEQTSGIAQRARFLGEAYLHIIGEALWTFDDVQRESVAAVLLRHKELRGVAFRYLDADKKLVSVAHGRTIELPTGTRLSDDVAANIQIFEKTGWIRLPIFYQDDRQPKIQIGELTLFVNNQRVLAQQALITVVTIAVGILGALLNWLVIRSVLTRHLAEPMRLLVVKLLQVQKIIPETEVDPTTFRKLKIERFGNEFRLLEKQLEKIIMANLALSEEAARPAKAAAGRRDSADMDSGTDPVNAPDDSMDPAAVADSTAGIPDTAQTPEAADDADDNKPA